MQKEKYEYENQCLHRQLYWLRNHQRVKCYSKLRLVCHNVFSKKDELDFIPTLILNLGSDKLTQIHTNKIFDRPAFSSRKKSDYSNKFQVQSVAASLDFTYMVKKFFIQPIVYFDYYLPETTENRFSAIFSITAGFSF